MGTRGLGGEGAKVRGFEGSKVRRFEGSKVRRFEGARDEMSSSFMALAVAVPGVLVALATGLSGIAILVADRPLLLAPRPSSIAEAAGNRDSSEIVLRAGLGEDPNEARLVRMPSRFNHPTLLTPLEAAIFSERTMTIDVLRDQGAVLDAPTLRRLRCYADSRHDRATIAYLSALTTAPLECAGIDVPR